ncbi:unnamed protein product [Calypogeia fissa]
METTSTTKMMAQNNDKVPGAKKESEIFVSSKALQVAEGWVRNMLGESDLEDDDEDSKAVELEARPPRLGLGAKYLPHSKVATTMSPVEKKLRAMTGAGKQQQRDGGHHIGKRNFSASTPAKESQSDSESDEEEEEVKGSSRIRHGRQQRRIGSADLLLKVSGSKGRGSKRKR